MRPADSRFRARSRRPAVVLGAQPLRPEIHEVLAVGSLEGRQSVPGGTVHDLDVVLAGLVLAQLGAFVEAILRGWSIRLGCGSPSPGCVARIMAAGGRRRDTSRIIPVGSKLRCAHRFRDCLSQPVHEIHPANLAAVRILAR